MKYFHYSQILFYVLRFKNLTTGVARSFGRHGGDCWRSGGSMYDRGLHRLLLSETVRNILRLHHIGQESLANAKISARQLCWPKTNFYMKYPLTVIQGHLFYNQFLANKG